jgi:hypothetical protein
VGWRLPDQWQLAQLPDVQLLQLDPDKALLEEPPATRAENTDIRRRRRRLPHSGQVSPFPLVPTLQRRSNT